MIKAGDVAHVRTTGEPVYVLEVAEGNASVRRPIMGQDGVRHETETFSLGELQTRDEQRDEQAATTREIYEKFGPKVSDATDSDPRFSSN
jgi:hypothetical protein